MAKAWMEKRVASQHLNPYGRLHGGNLMKWMDEVGADAARYHSDRFCVTVHVDNVSFLRPVAVGELLSIRASVNRSWGASMEVGLYAEVVDVDHGVRHLVASAYYVYVALDDDLKPVKVVDLVPYTDEERRRWREAGRRRTHRLAEKKRKEKRQE